MCVRVGGFVRNDPKKSLLKALNVRSGQGHQLQRRFLVGQGPHGNDRLSRSPNGADPTLAHVRQCQFGWRCRGGHGTVVTLCGSIGRRRGGVFPRRILLLNGTEEYRTRHDRGQGGRRGRSLYTIVSQQYITDNIGHGSGHDGHERSDGILGGQQDGL